MLPVALLERLGDATAANSIYGDPLGFVANNPVGTPLRDAVMDAYQHVQKLLCITGICLSVLIFAFACCLRNPFLTKDQSLPDAEKDQDDSSTDSGSA
jgi:SIT family siderophore-iron:H+ symporter-like MFS transporter